MIAIIGYDPEEGIRLSEKLTSLSIENTVTKNEKVICSADRVILPHCTNIDKVSKKLQILNLNTVVKMIKKPVLGIMSGGCLMGEAVTRDKLPALGFFPGQFCHDSNPINAECLELKWKPADEDPPFFQNNIVLKNITCKPVGNKSEPNGFYYKLNGTDYPAILKSKRNLAIFIDLLETGAYGDDLLIYFNQL
ncbi:MAG: hypothetical protein SCALA702_27230 [Melioribacteraceae bacterium]|nr:MAG: hypothetical protein SCALA702_27230 [Melioribacteraceae bacterium]